MAKNGPSTSQRLHEELGKIIADTTSWCTAIN